MRTRSSTAKRLLKFIVGVSAMTLLAASTALAATTATGAEFSKPFLNYSSQAPQKWTNTIPNALASYYTYQPFTAADAVKLGFPNAGNLGTPANPRNDVCGIAGVDAGSTADCYIISVRAFRQPMSLDFLKYVGISGFPGNGLLSDTGVPLVDTSHPTDPTNFLATNAVSGTFAYGYGSGGAGWQPYYPTTVTGGVRGNAPGAFQGVPFNALFGAGVNGDPAATGVWHFPAPTIKGTGRIAGATSGNRPVYVQWLNELPNQTQPGLDPTVDCGVNAPNCYPYNRQVVHVHGAHVGPESDGLATSWYTPNYGTSPGGALGEGAALFAASGTYAKTTLNPTPINYYPMDQEASTIWYHDHAIGATHTNTNMGMAGFFPVTDTQEQALITANKLPSGDTYDLGFALQDRHFDLTGQQIMPDYAIYDLTNAACATATAALGVPDPAACTRANFLKAADTSLTGWHFIPDTLANRTAIGFPNALNPDNSTGFACTSNANQPFPLAPPAVECAPFGATSATLEYFGVMPVVNGVTYGVYNVSPGVYRMRFIGGTDSRSWLLQLQLANGTVIPFYQIGSEQGLLSAPALRNVIDLMGGERIDVLVDFNTLPKDPGDATLVLPTQVFVKNLGDDAPYAGQLVTEPGITLPFPDGTLIPDVFVFNFAGGAVNYNSQNPATITSLNAHIPALKTAQYQRNIALVEITDSFGRTMPTIDARGYRPQEVPITENIMQNQVEEWSIINTTVDAHPMHLHQVAFQLINRQAVNAFTPPATAFIDNLGDAGYKPAAPIFPVFGYVDAHAANIYTQSQYAPVGPVIDPQPYETLALKDTVDCPPGYVTRIQTTFDIVGTYVWHCHILSHEEHDMMRPFRVVANKIATPAYVNPPATTDAFGNAYVIVASTTTAPIGTPLKYVVQFKKTTDTFWNTSNTSVRNPTIDLKPYGPGEYQFRAQVVNQILQDVATTNLADSNWVTSTRNTVYSTVAVAPAYLNIQTTTASSVYLISAPSSTPGAVYDFQYNNGSGWVSFGGANATRNKTFTLPAPGTYQFQVIITATGFTASTPRIAAGNVVIASAAVAPVYVNIQTQFPATGKVYLISAPAPQPGVSYEFGYSTDGTNYVWTNTGTVRNPYLQMPAPGTYTFKVRVTGGGFTTSSEVTAAGSFTY